MGRGPAFRWYRCQSPRVAAKRPSAVDRADRAWTQSIAGSGISAIAKRWFPAFPQQPWSVYRRHAGRWWCSAWSDLASRSQPDRVVVFRPARPVPLGGMRNANIRIGGAIGTAGDQFHGDHGDPAGGLDVPKYAAFLFERRGQVILGSSTLAGRSRRAAHVADQGAEDARVVTPQLELARPYRRRRSGSQERRHCPRCPARDPATAASHSSSRTLRR